MAAALAEEPATKRVKPNHSDDPAVALGAASAAWVGRDVVSQTQFDRNALELLFDLADRLRADVAAGKALKLLEGRLLACVFLEPSTRTSCSFQAAAQRLGATSILVNEQGSSAKKGESLEDTMRCLECYADCLVLRHPTKGSARRAAVACRKPVINGGDGTGEHPTQALLDVYTMRTEIRAATASSASTADALAGRVVVLVGDLKHGRTVHSLGTLLARNFPSVRLRFVSPPQLRMPADVCDEIAAHGVEATAHDGLEEVLGEADVLYVTRVQKERFEDAAEYEALKLRYVVTLQGLADCQAKSSLVIMHPLPRVGEIHPSVDSDPRAAYFRQMENGMFVRMALLALVMGAFESDGRVAS